MLRAYLLALFSHMVAKLVGDLYFSLHGPEAMSDLFESEAKVVEEGDPEPESEKDEDDPSPVKSEAQPQKKKKFKDFFRFVISARLCHKGFCNQPPSEGFGSLNPRGSLIQMDFSLVKVVTKNRWVVARPHSTRYSDQYDQHTLLFISYPHHDMYGSVFKFWSRKGSSVLKN